MEWFDRILPALPQQRIRDLCTLAALPRLCADVYEVTRLDAGACRGELSCVWGVFEAAVEPIRNGIRYALLSCPNALQWTVTTRNAETTVHCSINQAAPDPDFAESIAAFCANFRRGLAAASGAAPAP